MSASDRAMRFMYEVPGASSGTVNVAYPFALDVLSERTAGAIGLGVACYLAQFCLAERLTLTFPVEDAAIRTIAPLLQMLYDIRNWKDDAPFVPVPSIVAPSASRIAASPSPPDSAVSVVPWSGGKDSTLAIQRLRKMGARPVPTHFTANVGVESHERRAVSELSPLLDVEPLVVEVSHPEFVEFSGPYAENWDRFPLCNRVPFGRDLLIGVLATPVALSEGAGWISFGHDHECRRASVDYFGRGVPRNDVESVEGSAVLEALIDQHISPGTRLLPVVSDTSELAVLLEVIETAPDVFQRLAFCFWGARCGRCAKCLRHYLAQRLAGVDLLEFDVNPLATGMCPELDDLLRAVPGESEDGLLFQGQVSYCLARLAQRGDVRPEEDVLSWFRAEMLPSVEHRVDDWEEELFARHPDPQLDRFSLSDAH